MATVKRPFTFKHVDYNPGDEIDLESLDIEDKADLVSRGYFDEPHKASDEKPKTETKATVKRSKTK